MSAIKKCGIGIFNALIQYQTAKIVTVHSVTIGLFNRIVQLTVVVYIIAVAIVMKKGYQEFDTVQSSVTTKLKGIASTMDRTDVREEYRRIWDVADYVMPPQENDAFFVLTNAIITQGQTRNVCAELPSIATCSSTNNPCDEGKTMATGNGVMTGECIPYDKNTTTCEIRGWCTVEADKLPNSNASLLPEAANFTVLIKNMVEFPKFGAKFRNILNKIGDKYLRTCQYHETHDPNCPIFRLGYIAELAGANIEEISKLGGVINILITWDCNLDHEYSYCMPKYDFRRLDSNDTKISPGYNFRFAHYYRLANGTEARDLIKAYGIRFVFTVQGKAGKFSVVPLLMNLAAGLALLGVATLLSDLILLRVVKNRQVYRASKYLNVADSASQADDEEHPKKQQVKQGPKPKKNEPTKNGQPRSSETDNAQTASTPS